MLQIYNDYILTLFFDGKTEIVSHQTNMYPIQIWANVFNVDVF